MSSNYGERVTSAVGRDSGLTRGSGDVWHSGKPRMDLVLAQPNAAAIVPRMPIQDLYYTIQAVGLEDAGELLALSAPTS